MIPKLTDLFIFNDRIVYNHNIGHLLVIGQKYLAYHIDKNFSGTSPNFLRVA